MDKTRKKVIKELIVVFVLFLMLTITTYALVTSLVSVDKNEFLMGQVKIELNGGKTIFDGSDFNIEPGYSAKRDFTIENKGTADAYYRLYLENVNGSLQDVLVFEIYDGTELLYSGTAADFNKENPCVGKTEIKAGEVKWLTAVVKMKENSSNDYQNAFISFDMTADAVQSKNNADKSFE